MYFFNAYGLLLLARGRDCRKWRLSSVEQRGRLDSTVIILAVLLADSKNLYNTHTNLYNTHTKLQTLKHSVLFLLVNIMHLYNLRQDTYISRDNKNYYL